jgi:hypothetical protein
LFRISDPSPGSFDDEDLLIGHGFGVFAAGASDSIMKKLVSLGTYLWFFFSRKDVDWPWRRRAP